MPSTLRMLRTILILVALAWAAAWALATFVKPSFREMTVSVPVEVAPQ
jgi:hypothetical protein